MMWKVSSMTLPASVHSPHTPLPIPPVSTPTRTCPCVRLRQRLRALHLHHPTTSSSCVVLCRVEFTSCCFCNFHPPSSLILHFTYFHLPSFCCCCCCWVCEKCVRQLSLPSRHYPPLPTSPYPPAESKTKLFRFVSFLLSFEFEYK